MSSKRREGRMEGGDTGRECLSKLSQFIAIVSEGKLNIFLCAVRTPIKLLRSLLQVVLGLCEQ